MEIILELVLEFLGELIFELLAESSFRVATRALSNRVVRVVLGLAVALAFGFGGGFWWGARLSEAGRTDPPRALAVSVALSLAFAVLALLVTLQDRRAARGSADAEPIPSGRLPWQWPPMRLLGFAWLNAAVAAGIAAGFVPRPLG